MSSPLDLLADPAGGNMVSAVQLRLDGVNGYGLPLRPEALAELTEFEVDHICACLKLDAEQTRCAEAAVALVLTGGYPPRGHRQRWLDDPV